MDPQRYGHSVSGSLLAQERIDKPKPFSPKPVHLLTLVGVTEFREGLFSSPSSVFPARCR